MPGGGIHDPHGSWLAVAMNPRAGTTSWAAVFVFSVTALLDLAMLRFVGWSSVDLVAFAIVVLVWVSAGLAALRWRSDRFPDRLSLFATAVIIGMVLHAGLCFVAFHLPFQELVDIPGNRQAARAAFMWLLLPALLAAVGRPRAEPPARWVAEPLPAALLFAFASCVALLTAFGYLNSREPEGGHLKARVVSGAPVFGTRYPPNWGSDQDRESQLMGGGLGLGRRFPNAFPFDRVSHRGVETTLSGVALLGGRFSDKRWARVSKPLCLLWLFLASYWIFRIAKDRSQSDGSALLAGAGALLYAALNPYVLRAAISSYGVCPASGTLYHNVHQQASLAIGLGGLYLVLRDLRRPRGLLGIGCTLVGASLFFKPSFYAMVVPALGIGIWFARGFRIGWDAILGLGAILCCAGIWFAYPTLFAVEMRWTVPIDFGFLPWHQAAARPAMAWQASGPVALLASVVLLGHAAWMLPVASVARRLIENRDRMEGMRSWIAPSSLVLLIAAASGILSGYVLRASSGNFMWGSAVGIVCALPLVTGEIAAIRRGLVRGVAWLVFFAHLASGAWNLWLFGYHEIFWTT
jgi:hypothetical protein